MCCTHMHQNGRYTGKLNIQGKEERQNTKLMTVVDKEEKGRPGYDTVVREKHISRYMPRSRMS